MRTCSLFQLFDGPQVVTTGVLRGIGETRTPMIVAFIGYWIIGFPTGCTLCFAFGYGASGLWVGTLVGLCAVGAVLLAV